MTAPSGLSTAENRIPRGRDTLEVVEVRAEEDHVTLIVKPG
jgi:hypothetical protein